MPKGHKPKRETKKVKKKVGKAIFSSAVEVPSPDVQVVRKPRKPREEDESS